MIATGDGAGLGVTAELHRRDAVEALAIALLERDRYTGEHSAGPSCARSDTRPSRDASQPG